MANIRMLKYMNGCCFVFKTKTINGYKSKHYFRIFDDNEIIIYTVMKLLEHDHKDGNMVKKFKNKFLHKEEIYIKQKTFKTLMAIFEFDKKKDNTNPPTK